MLPIRDYKLFIDGLQELRRTVVFQSNERSKGLCPSSFLWYKAMLSNRAALLGVTNIIDWVKALQDWAAVCEEAGVFGGMAPEAEAILAREKAETYEKAMMKMTLAKWRNILRIKIFSAWKQYVQRVKADNEKELIEQDALSYTEVCLAQTYWKVYLTVRKRNFSLIQQLKEQVLRQKLERDELQLVVEAKTERANELQSEIENQEKIVFTLRRELEKEQYAHQRKEN